MKIRALDVSEANSYIKRILINDPIPVSYTHLSVCDALICDGFTGNTLLKSCEGVAMSLMKLLKDKFMESFKGKVGALMLKDSFKEIKSMMEMCIRDSPKHILNPGKLYKVN